MLTAITRGVSPAFGSCQLEYLPRREIDVAKASAQHREYEARLRDLGVRVHSLAPDGNAPDSVFVEDPAIVLDEVAILTRMGTDARRKESESLADALAQFRPLRSIREPATLEGGDVMRAGKTLYVGLSRRTNREGVVQLAELVQPFEYKVVPVHVTGCMHLKTACSWLGGDRLLVNRDWIDTGAFSAFTILDVPPEESWSANVLYIREAVIVSVACPHTAELLTKIGFEVKPVDISELAKAEGGLTCMSLIFVNPANS